jgi:lycopene cyclase domain-containing protein
MTMYTYLLFLLAVSFPAIGYAVIHRRYLRRDFGFRLFPAYIFWMALGFFAIEVLALKADWWGIYAGKTLGVALLGVPVEEFVFFLLIPQISLLVWALSRQPGSWKRAKYLSGHHLRQWRQR